MTFEEFMKHVADAAYVGDADALRGYAKRVFDERDEAQAEIEMLRGVGCREAKDGEPESGPCGVCLRCAEERGAAWAIRAKAQVVYALLGGDVAYALLAREVCNKAREKR